MKPFTYIPYLIVAFALLFVLLMVDITLSFFINIPPWHLWAFGVAYSPFFIILFYVLHLIFKQNVHAYAWLCASVTYPFAKRAIRKKYELMTPSERLRVWSKYIVTDHWTKDHWFGRRLSNYVLIKFIAVDVQPKEVPLFEEN